MDEITSVKINELPSGDVAAENLFIFGVGDKMYTDLISSLVALVPTTTVGIKASLSDYNVTVLEADLTSFLNTINLTIAAGDVKFIRFFLIDSQMYLSRMTYAVPLSNGTYNPLGSSLAFSDLIMINKEYMMPNADANTVTYSFDSIAEINTSDPAIDLSDSLLAYILIISDVSYLFIGINGVYGDGELQIEETDLSLINTGPQFNLKVYESGETPIENINEIAFSGATVTDDGGGKVTVTITDSGVTEFTELTDVPASYTGQGSKVVAVKVDETGLEFVAGGGISQDLQDTLDNGKTATFTDEQGTQIDINLGEYSEDNFSSPISFIHSRTFENIEQIAGFHQELGVSEIRTYIFDLLTNIGKYGGIATSNGDVLMYIQNQYPTKFADQSFSLEDISEADIPIENLEIFYKPKPKFVSGTYYLVDEEYVTNAIAGVTTPDATPTTKGIAKLYNSLGSNTDGAVDQNTVNTALDLKANLQNVENYFISKSNGTFGSHTGDLLETVLLSETITGGVFEASDWLKFLYDLNKTGTAGNVTLRVRAGLTGTTADTLIATYISPSGDKDISFNRKRMQFLTGDLLSGFRNITNSTNDNIGSVTKTTASVIPSADWKLTITAILGNASDVVDLVGLRVSKIKSI